MSVGGAARSTSRFTAVLSLCAALALVVTPSALAGTASVGLEGTCDSKGPCVYTASLRSDGDEANAVTLVSDGTAIVISDARAPITPGRDCVALTERSVRCTGPAPDGIDAVRVDAGPGDDSVSGEGFDRQAYIYGGPGNDVLVGTRGSDSLDGGGGFDRVWGGSGDDRLSDGDDGTAERPIDGDRLDGGSGRDWISYEQRDQAVTVDLARPETAGAPGEGDALVSIERASGGDGPDRLAAGAAPTFLDGRGGADRIVGSGSNDFLIGGSGRDALAGGRGSDVLQDYDRSADDVACGAGSDTVRGVRTPDVITTDCERIKPDRAGVTVVARNLAASGGFEAFLLEGFCAGFERCRVTVRVTAASSRGGPVGRLVGAETVERKSRGPLRGTVPISRREREALRGHPSARLHVTTRVEGLDPVFHRGGFYVRPAR